MAIFNLSDAVLSLGERVYEFNRIFSEFYERFVSEIYPGKEPLYRSEIDGLFAAIGRLEKRSNEMLKVGENGENELSEFERLAIRSAKDGLMAQRAYLDYFITREITSFEEAASIILGSDPIELHEKYLANVIDEPVYFEQAATRAKEEPFDLTGMDETVKLLLLERLKDLVMRYAAEEHLFPKEIENIFEERIDNLITLRVGIDPYDEGGAYLEKEHKIELSSYHFRPYKTAKYAEVINPGIALLVLVHEIFAHALNSLYSSLLPVHLQGKIANVDSLANMVVFEGLALLREGTIPEQDPIRELGQHGIRLLYNRGKGYVVGNLRSIPLREGEIQFSLTQNLHHFNTMTYNTYVKFLFLDNKGDSEKAEGVLQKRLFSEREGKVLQIRPKLRLTEPTRMPDIFYDLSYLTGVDFFRTCLGDVKQHYEKKFGKDATKQIQEDRLFLNAVLSTGLWSWQTFPDWIAFALKNKKAFTNEYIKNLFSED